VSGSIVTLVVVLALLLFVASVILRTIKIVPQQTAVIIERLGSYSRTLDDGMHILVPFIDKPRATIDLREQVVTFPPQPVITSRQPRRLHRHGHLLHGDRRQVGGLRDRQLHPRHRATHRDDAA
jgi:hypothetical protein